jgi:hypothetical protein
VQAGNQNFFDQLVVEHFPTLVGIPAAVLMALFLVLVLRTVSGAIEFKGLGFEFRGASGPIIMWILVFVSMTFGVCETWSHVATVPQSSAATISSKPSTR